MGSYILLAVDEGSGVVHRDFVALLGEVDSVACGQDFLGEAHDCFVVMKFRMEYGVGVVG